MADPSPELNSFALDTREDLVINAIEIFDTIKQSLVVLDKNLNVVMANASFYKTFKVTRPETEGTVIYDIGNGQCVPCHNGPLFTDQHACCLRKLSPTASRSMITK